MEERKKLWIGYDLAQDQVNSKYKISNIKYQMLNAV